MEAGRSLLLEKGPFNFPDEIRTAITRYGREWPGHRFESDLPGEEVKLVADGGKLVQVLENLLSNAVKYSRSGSRIVVRANCEGEVLKVCVEDEGIGMTGEQVERIFEKFYRVDTSDTAVGGLGLGMSIVKNIIEAHGGEIKVESVIGRGTRVCFTLPLDSR